MLTEDCQTESIAERRKLLLQRCLKTAISRTEAHSGERGRRFENFIEKSVFL